MDKADNFLCEFPAPEVCVQISTEYALKVAPVHGGRARQLCKSSHWHSLARLAICLDTIPPLTFYVDYLRALTWLCFSKQRSRKGLGK